MAALKQLLYFGVIGSLILSTSTPCYASEKWGICELRDVMVWNGSRIHIQCSNKPDGFTFFAVPLSDAEFANQVLSIATAALVYNKTLGVLFNPSDKTTGPTFDCAEGSCRPLIALSLNP